MVEVGARALFSSHPLVPLPVLSPWGRALDAMRFLVRPTPQFARHGWSAALVAALASVFALHLAVDWAATWLLAAWDEQAGLLPAPLEDQALPGGAAVSGLLLAPVLEEALHRGWMSGRIAALRFAAFGYAAAACLLAGLAAGEQAQGWLAIAAVMLALAGFAQWLMTRERDAAVPAWFTRHFALLVWTGSLFFALMHLGNYAPLTHPLGVLVVAPQAIGGLFLAYVRTRLGLRAAMVHHAAYNGLFLLSEQAWWG